ncbi:hypothetical protein ALC53_09609 [Atta colombica]|uniref:Uncharacterized protein n=1 Tax=Atta colombica TaxID=520822 RepID=A0A151I226_9HYME|nr:hypothetical protein ALC53_09609 [Atta colombica]
MCRENNDIPFIADSSAEFRIGVAMPDIHRRIIISLTFLLSTRKQRVLIRFIFSFTRDSPIIRVLSTTAKNVQLCE